MRGGGWVKQKKSSVRVGRQQKRRCFLQGEGLLTFLRVNEPGYGYGGGKSNKIDVEVIFRLDTFRSKAFGFQLRDDAYGPAREAMLSLLRVAITERLRVRVDFDEFVQPPNENCIAKIVALVPGQSSRPSRAAP